MHTPTTLIEPRTSPRTSPLKIRVKASVSTKKNADAAGKIGKYKGKTANNMYILEVEGKIYNFFKKDLENPDIIGLKKSPKHTSPKKLSPDSSTADRIANDFIRGLDANIANKVISAICKRRTSRVKKSPVSGKVKTPPVRRRSPAMKVCKENEEISSKTGRCINKCKTDQERDSVTNRCRKRTSNAKSIQSTQSTQSTHIIPHIPKRQTPVTSIEDDEDLLVPETYEQLEPRVRMKRPTPT